MMEGKYKEFRLICIGPSSTGKHLQYFRYRNEADNFLGPIVYDIRAVKINRPVKKRKKKKQKNQTRIDTQK
jgi:hypothetical protein